MSHDELLGDPETRAAQHRMFTLLVHWWLLHHEDNAAAWLGPCRDEDKAFAVTVNAGRPLGFWRQQTKGTR